LGNKKILWNNNKNLMDCYLRDIVKYQVYKLGCKGPRDNPTYSYLVISYFHDIYSILIGWENLDKYTADC
jgi:hypothetical protein